MQGVLSMSHHFGYHLYCNFGDQLTRVMCRGNPAMVA